MVNYGVSRACLTCKKRRKKCDEARPSCARCTKANLECLGYEAEIDLKFRHCVVKQKYPRNQLEKQPSISSYFIDDAWIANFALIEFFHDYCLIPKDKFLSRGYLSGLGKLIARVDPCSDVATATRTAAFASLANKYHDNHLSERSKAEYSKLLKSFSATMSKPETSNTLESLTTAVLLGIYEIISGNRDHPGEHRAHCRGMAAILSSKSAIINQHPLKHFWPEEDLAHHLGKTDAVVFPHELEVISPPDPGPSVPSLDTLLQAYAPMFRRGRILTANLNTSVEELQEFRDFAITVDQEFALWPSKQPLSWQPRLLGLVDPLFKNGLLPGSTFAPTRIDVYLDLYVSYVWNSFRKCRLVLLALIHECSTRLQAQNIDLEEERIPDVYKLHNIMKLAENISGDIAASVPFHLVRNPEIYITKEHQTDPMQEATILPNISAGGLLIMHVIYVGSMTPIVPQSIRQGFRQDLAYIGKVMGIGQAEVISDSLSTFPREFILDGHILVGAGMVVP